MSQTLLKVFVLLTFIGLNWGSSCDCPENPHIIYNGRIAKCDSTEKGLALNLLNKEEYDLAKIFLKFNSDCGVSNYSKVSSMGVQVR